MLEEMVSTATSRPSAAIRGARTPHHSRIPVAGYLQHDASRKAQGTRHEHVVRDVNEESHGCANRRGRSCRDDEPKSQAHAARGHVRHGLGSISLQGTIICHLRAELVTQGSAAAREAPLKSYSVCWPLGHPGGSLGSPMDVVCFLNGGYGGVMRGWMARIGKLIKRSLTPAHGRFHSLLYLYLNRNLLRRRGLQISFIQFIHLYTLSFQVGRHNQDGGGGLKKEEATFKTGTGRGFEERHGYHVMHGNHNLKPIYLTSSVRGCVLCGCLPGTHAKDINR